MCVNIGTECWCHHNRNTPGYSVCGHPNDYHGKYFSLAIDSSHSYKTIIESLGQQVDSPGGDCATNVCQPRCTGSELTCWSDQQRWQRSEYAGIVRCINMEGIFKLCTVCLYCTNLKLSCLIVMNVDFFESYR